MVNSVVQRTKGIIPWKEEERVWKVRKHVNKSLMVLPMGM